MKIIVDADACPKQALQVCHRLGEKYGVAVYTIASFNHVIQGENHIVVGNNSQEVDYKVANLAARGDIVVTQDYGLASVVLGKGAGALSPIGREFSAQTIAFLLEEREAKAKFRRGGGRTRGPRKRTAADDQAFATTLERMLQLIPRSFSTEF